MRMKRGAIVQLVRESARDGAYTTEVAATGTADATRYSELALIFFKGPGSGRVGCVCCRSHQKLVTWTIPFLIRVSRLTAHSSTLAAAQKL